MVKYDRVVLHFIIFENLNNFLLKLEFYAAWALIVQLTKQTKKILQLCYGYAKKKMYICANLIFQFIGIIKVLWH